MEKQKMIAVILKNDSLYSHEQLIKLDELQLKRAYNSMFIGLREKQTLNLLVKNGKQK